MIQSMLKEYGYTDGQIKKILDSYICKDLGAELLINYLREKINFFESFGYMKLQIIKMIVSYPSLCTYGLDNLIKKIDFMKSLGYKDEEIIKITVAAPQVYGRSIDSIKQKIEELETLGYTREQVLKLMLLSPAILSSGIDNIKQKFSDLENLGYTKNEVLKITNFFPTVYGISMENVVGKVNTIMSFGYSRDEALKIIIGLPTILGYSNENLKEKFSFFVQVGLMDAPIVKARNLMQSVDLTYARFRFLTEEKKKCVSMKLVSSLFIGADSFKSIYKISKEELLKRYSYDEEVRRTKDKSKEKSLVQG